MCYVICHKYIIIYINSIQEVHFVKAQVSFFNIHVRNKTLKMKLQRHRHDMFYKNKCFLKITTYKSNQDK